MKREEKTLSKIFYGLADIYGGGSFLIISILYMVFLTDVVRMLPILAGTIPLIGKIWDAVTDPIMGNIADRTSSKFGAKRLYLLIGSGLAGITFFSMWLTIEGSMAMQYSFYLLMYIFFSTAFTIVMVPYNALLPDMIEDYTQRGVYTAYRMVFSALSAIIAGLIPNAIINSFGENAKTGFWVMGLVFGLLFFLSIFLTFLGTWENPIQKSSKSLKESFSESFSVFKNKSFKLYLGIFLLGQGSSDFVTGGVIYFLAVVLRNSNQYTAVMASVLISQLLAMFFYQVIIKKYSKKTPVLIGFPLRIVATFAMIFFAYAGAPAMPIIILSFLAGIGTAASSVTSYAILTDLSDVDLLITTQKRPGVYSGMATFSRKIANGLAIWLLGAMLSLFRYNPDLDFQSDITVSGIKIMFIGLPIIMMIGTFLFTLKFPIDTKTYSVLQRDINRRLGKDTSKPTLEEKTTCETITGYSYENLWRAENAKL